MKDEQEVRDLQRHLDFPVDRLRVKYRYCKNKECVQLSLIRHTIYHETIQ